jgi:hypothetical protein
MKNMKNKIIVIISFLSGIFLLSSCLKDDADFWQEDVAGKMYATIANPGLQTQSLLPVPDEVTISFLVNIASDALPGTTNTITLAFDNAAIAAYDSTLKQAAIANNDTLDNGDPKYKNYVPYPGAVLLTPTITIPAGSRNAYAQIKVARADTIQLTGNYMAAVTITASSQPIAANMKTVLYAFPLANAYEGDYLSEGFRDHPVNGIEPYLYAKLHFSTVNGNTVHKTQVGNYTGYGLDITITNRVVVVAGVNCFECDLQITGMASSTDGGQYPTFEGNPTNYYNPVTKVFDLYYYYNKAAPRKLREIDSRI